jgi:hypothetical protein
MATMKTTLAVACFAAALAGGCYQSDLPLDPAPAVDLEEQWLGTWRCLPFNADADEEPVTIAVARGRDRRYEVTWREAGKGPEHYEAFASSVHGRRFMNVRELKAAGETGQWVFVRPTLLGPNVLQLQIVDDKALDGVEKSAPAVRRAIERQVSKAALTMDFCVCVRAKETTQPTPGR